MTHEKEANPENWDFENAERRPPAQRGRAIVSVAFNRDDFEAIGEAAEEFGMKLSEFIRHAALDRARPHVLVFGALATEARGPAAGAHIEEPEERNITSAPSLLPA